MTDALHDKLRGDVETCRDAMLSLLRSGAAWRCDLGHTHGRPESFTARELCHQAEMWFRRRNPRHEVYSSSTWMLAAYALMDDGTLARDNRWRLSRFSDGGGVS